MTQSLRRCWHPVVPWSVVCGLWSRNPVVPFEPANLVLFDELQLAAQVMQRAEVAGDVKQHHGNEGENDDHSHAVLAAGVGETWSVERGA